MLKLKMAAFPAIVMLVLGGCSGFFEFNLFKGIDPVEVPTVATYQGEGGLDNLEDDLDSPAVTDTLTPGTVAEIEEMLDDDYLDDGVQDEEDQQAAILLGELNLKTTGGDDVVNNIVELAADVIFSAGGEAPAPEDIATDLLGVIPADVMASPEAFTELILGFLDANAAYTALGDSIDTIGVPDANMGEVAQNAVVAFAVDTIVDTLMGAGHTQEESIVLLQQMITDPSSVDPADIDAIQAPDISDANPEAAAVLNILEAAGVDLESMFGGGVE